MAAQKQSVDIMSLPPNEIIYVRKQLEEEVQFLQDSLRQLQGAVNKFSQSKGVLKNLAQDNEGNEIFIPLTSSLYVPGSIVNADKVLIDIGTGFFVEKTLIEAIEYKDRKAKFVIKNAQQVSNVLEGKSRDLSNIDAILQRKLEAMQQMPVKPQ